jgi:hypothetical protein
VVIPAPARNARLMPALVVLAATLAGCSHLHVPHPHAARLWPFHHKAATPPEAVNELVADTPDGSPAPGLSQYWDRNTLLIDLSAAAGEGSVRLRPAAGTSWPIRLEFRVQPGSIARLQIQGAQRVTYAVPAAGSPVLLKLDPGVYTTRTAALVIEWHSAAAAGG